MLPQVPHYLNLAFVLITITTVVLFYSATNKNKKALVVILCWLVLQGILSFVGFYSIENIHPLRMVSTFVPTLILIAFVVLSKRTSNFIQSLDLAKLTLLHTIRIPVELALYTLFVYHTIPEIMTFEGRNYDILAGITAPIIYYAAFYKKQLSKDLLLAWNFISLFLLLNIIIYAVLSLELPFQQFGLDQPNRAIRYFPFIWLPAVIVPIVLFAHLATITRLLKKQATR